MSTTTATRKSQILTDEKLTACAKHNVKMRDGHECTFCLRDRIGPEEFQKWLFRVR